MAALLRNLRYTCGMWFPHEFRLRFFVRSSLVLFGHGYLYFLSMPKKKKTSMNVDIGQVKEVRPVVDRLCDMFADIGQFVRACACVCSLTHGKNEHGSSAHRHITSLVSVLIRLAQSLFFEGRKPTSQPTSSCFNDTCFVRKSRRGTQVRETTKLNHDTPKGELRCTWRRMHY